MTPNWEMIYITNVFMKNIVVGNCVNLFTLVICVRKWHILSRFSWLNFCLTDHSWPRSVEGKLVRGVCSLCTASTSLWLISSESNLPIICLLYITNLKTLKTHYSVSYSLYRNSPHQRKKLKDKGPQYNRKMQHVLLSKKLPESNTYLIVLRYCLRFCRQRNPVAFPT